MSQNIPPENQLYEWSLKKIAIAAGTGLAALIGLGVKKAVNTATVKAYKGRLDRILMDFKERLSENVEKRATKYKQAIEGEGDQKLTREKKRQFQKLLLDYVKKEIAALGKKIYDKIEKIPAGKKGKESLKIYWETITTSVELDLLEKLHKLDIIGEEDREILSEKASADLEKFITLFLKKFGLEETEPETSDYQKLKNTFESIKESYDKKDKLDIEELEEVIEKIDLWKEFYDEIENQLSQEEKDSLVSDITGAEVMKKSLIEFKEDIAIEKRIRDYRKTLFDYMETLFDNRAKYLKSSLGSGNYQDYKDHKKMVSFVRFIVDEIMDDPAEYEKQEKLLKAKSISDKNLVVLFLKVFMNKFEEEQTNESFVSFYDYYKNQI